MIETITVLFRSRADCSDWADKVTAQIRAARQSAVLPSKLSVQPLPPPHVSVAPGVPGPGVSPHYYGHSPPYVALTAWIRENLARNKLTFNHIKSLQRPPRVISDSSASDQGRSHKVECVIYPSSSQLDLISDTRDHHSLLDKAPVVLKDPQMTESNPFGYIHYIPSFSDNSSEKDFLKSNIANENEDLITLVRPSEKEDSVSKNKDAVSYSEEDMTFLLPRSLLNSSTDSQSRTISRNDTIHSMGVSNETDESFTPGVDLGPWGKKLPSINQFGDDPTSTEPRYRIASEGSYDNRQKLSSKTQIVQYLSAPVLNKEPGSRPRGVIKVQCKHQRDFQKEESPPDWLSCFASPKTRKKHFQRSEDVYSKSSTQSVSSCHKSQSPIKYIDKTPSENSLDLPYCPPVKLDYEQFSQLDYLSSSKGQRKISTSLSQRSESKSQSRSGSRPRGRASDLAVIPVSDQAELFTIPETPVSPRPVRKHRSQVVAQIGMYPPSSSRCVCDSMRSSDSGLADMTRHQGGCPQGSLVSGLQTPLSPTLSRQSRFNSSQTSPSQARRGETRDSVYTCPSASTSLASGDSTQTCNLTDFTLKQPRSHRLHESKSEKNLSERPQLDTQMSVSLEDVKICDEEKNTENAFTDCPSPVVKSPQWSRTKEIYTTGLYAHWWLNASLQPISEENLSDKLTENL